VWLEAFAAALASNLTVIPEQRELVDSAINHLESCPNAVRVTSARSSGPEFDGGHRPKQGALDCAEGGRSRSIPELQPRPTSCYAAACLSLGETDEANERVSNFLWNTQAACLHYDSGPVADNAKPSILTRWTASSRMRNCRMRCTVLRSISMPTKTFAYLGPDSTDFSWTHRILSMRVRDPRGGDVAAVLV